jgi:predicted GNAT family N-acyltransferase
MSSPEIEEYVKELKSDLERGLISQEEFDDSLTSLGIKKDNELPRIVVRTAEPEDYTKIEQFSDLFYRELFGRPKGEKDEDLDNSRKLIARTEDDGIIGFAEFSVEPTEAYNGCVYLDKVVIDHRFRCSGIGSLLIYEIIRMMYELGKIEQMVLHAPENICGFYARNGFFVTPGVEKEEGVELRKLVLPFTKNAYTEVHHDLEEPECDRCTEYRQHLDEKVRDIEEEKFEENSFLELLRKNLPPKEKYELRL